MYCENQLSGQAAIFAGIFHMYRTDTYILSQYYRYCVYWLISNKKLQYGKASTYSIVIKIVFMLWVCKKKINLWLSHFWTICVSLKNPVLHSFLSHFDIANECFLNLVKQQKLANGVLKKSVIWEFLTVSPFIVLDIECRTVRCFVSAVLRLFVKTLQAAFVCINDERWGRYAKM